MISPYFLYDNTQTGYLGERTLQIQKLYIQYKDRR